MEIPVAAGDITLLLKRLGTEQGPARKQIYDRLVSLVYEDLRQRARQQMWRESPGRSLQPTALVHDAYERLIQYEMPFENREHFFNVAAKAMRHLLIDRARKLRAVKRGRGQHATQLREDHAVTAQDPETLLAIDQVLDTLRPEQVQLVELRYFGGLTMNEAAQVMGLDPETARKRWQVIRLLLFDKLKRRAADESR
jgi:RNA polymerase sigma-70 factor (ECF subfamily)